MQTLETTFRVPSAIFGVYKIAGYRTHNMAQQTVYLITGANRGKALLSRLLN